MTPDLSIIIVNWNTCQLLADCLSSIAQTAGNLNLEIIVVDNGSTDGSQLTLKQQFPQVHLVENNQNLGFAKANNQALTLSRGRYALLLNSDTIVLPGALADLVRFADTHSDAGIIGCKLLNADGSLQESWASFPTLWSEILGRNFRRRRLVDETSSVYEVDWVGGACMLARPEAMREVGFLDESYFMYSEETDWCFRMQRHGWKVYYLAGSNIIHLGGGSASRASLTQLMRLYQSKLHFFQQHYGLGQAKLLQYGLVVMSLIGLTYRALAWPLTRKQEEVSHQLKVRWQLVQWLWQGQQLFSSAPLASETALNKINLS